LVYQPPVDNTFLSEQTSHQQPVSSTFLSEQTSISHQPNEQAAQLSAEAFDARSFHVVLMSQLSLGSKVSKLVCSSMCLADYCRPIENPEP
jgi:hypothetical protein